tara:strand:- start:376 stop:585 length:210 start_codon:yes stop_codon:yes gene_type:complete
MMNGLYNVIRFITYSIGGIAVRKGWNWLTEDVDPIPGTKEFDDEYRQVRNRYLRLRKQKEDYETYRKGR